MSTTFYTLSWKNDRGHFTFIDSINTDAGFFLLTLEHLTEDGIEVTINRSSPEGVEEIALEDLVEVTLYNGDWEPVGFKS